MNDYIILYLLTGTRGGINRIQILKLLSKGNLNAHKIKEKLKIDYKTVQHHLRLLLKHRFVTTSNKYGALYLLTDEFKIHMNLFKEILAKVNKSIERL